MSRLLPESFGNPPARLDGEDCYAWDRRVNAEYPEALMWFLRLHGYRPPECAPGLYEAFLPDAADSYLVLTDRGTLNGDADPAWLPRREPWDGSGSNWGRGTGDDGPTIRRATRASSAPRFRDLSSWRHPPRGRIAKSRERVRRPRPFSRTTNNRRRSIR